MFWFCIPAGICKIKVTAFGRFIISSDFDLAQHFSCSVKTVECGQIFLLACRQLRKKAQHNISGQFKNLLNLPNISSGLRVWKRVVHKKRCTST